MHKKFEINQTKIKGGSQFGRKVVNHSSKSDLPLDGIAVPNMSTACSFSILHKTFCMEVVALTLRASLRVSVLSNFLVPDSSSKGRPGYQD